MIDAAGVERARIVADVIDRYVSADVDLATSVIGMGLDALATTLRNRPAETYDDLAPWIVLGAEVFVYVETGAVGPTLADRFGDLLATVTHDA